MPTGGFDAGEFDQRETSVAADERDLDTLNCPSCLHPMQVGVTGSGSPIWACPPCGVAMVA